MSQFEYKTINVLFTHSEATLNELGREGWEAVSCHSRANQEWLLVLMKREIEKEPIPESENAWVTGMIHSYKDDIEVNKYKKIIDGTEVEMQNQIKDKKLSDLDKPKKRPGRKPGVKNKPKDGKK